MATRIAANEERKPLWKPQRVDKAKPQPISQNGKASKQRAADKRALVKREPATHEENHYCYIGAHWVKHFVLEHVFDASTHPELFDKPKNHRKACDPHNIAKKLGRLTPTELARVKRAEKEVFNG